jgi:ribosomal protein L29
MYIESGSKTALNVARAKRRIVSLVMIFAIIICLFWIKLQRSNIVNIKKSSESTKKNIDHIKDQVVKLTRDKVNLEQKLSLKTEELNKANKKMAGLAGKEKGINRLKRQIARLKTQLKEMANRNVSPSPTRVIPKNHIKGERRIIFNKSIPVNREYVDSVILSYGQDDKVRVKVKLMNKSSQAIKGYGFIIYLYDRERKKVGVIRDDSRWSIFTPRKNKLPPGRGKIKIFVVPVEKLPKYFTVSIY